MTCSCEHGNGPSGFIKDGALLSHGGDNRLLFNLSVLSHLLFNCPCEWDRGFISSCIIYLHPESDNFKCSGLTTIVDRLTHTHTQLRNKDQQNALFFP